MSTFQNEIVSWETVRPGTDIQVKVEGGWVRKRFTTPAVVYKTRDGNSFFYQLPEDKPDEPLQDERTKRARKGGAKRKK